MNDFEAKIQQLFNTKLTDDEQIAELKKHGFEGDADYGALCVLNLFKKAMETKDVSALKEIRSAVSLKEEATGGFLVPALYIADTFLPIYRRLHNGDGADIVLYGGRGSTKSSFISLCIIELIMNNPNLHACVFRKIKDTIRDSVYAQLVWAIGKLNLSSSFEMRTSPLEIEYLPTGQKIYFRGADKPDKIKSIKPPFGHIGVLWFEELDQFSGPEEIRCIEQSAIRGGDEAYVFKSFNPPRSVRSWANKYVTEAPPSLICHKSTYLDVPPEWLGKKFLDDAELLKEQDEGAYKHEYLGFPTGYGGAVFENVEAREISRREIENLDHRLYGIDWGWYPDPFRFVACSYKNGTLYIFGEISGNKLTNDKIAELLKAFGIGKTDLIVADSGGEGPKTIADFRARGFYMRGARKGKGSVEHSMKWLSSLRKIVIDPVRCPHTYEEFTLYEYEKAPDGSFISGYPDRDNHSIDAVRYATISVRRAEKR